MNAKEALSGVASSGQTDSGVSARLFGSLLTWMNDHTSDVYLVATCNDITKLPPEFSRAERFDGIFFLNLPGRSEKDVIWQLYLQQFQLDGNQRIPDDENWTGAEIRACCRLACATRPALGPGRPKRRAGGGHGQRVGRAFAELGQRAMLECRRGGHLSPRSRWLRVTTARQSRSVAELIVDLSM